MNRATSIAGVRPQGWLTRVCAPTEQFLGVGVPSAVAWRMARALRGWGQSRRWAWEHAMILPVSARGPGQGSCRRIPLHAQEESQMLARAACAPMTVPECSYRYKL